MRLPPYVIRVAMRDAIESRSFAVRMTFGGTKADRHAFYIEASSRLDALCVAVFDATYQPILRKYLPSNRAADRRRPSYEAKVELRISKVGSRRYKFSNVVCR